MRTFLRYWFVWVVLGLLLVAAAAYFYGQQARRPQDIRAAVPVTRYTLSNGLQLAVIENHQLPAVTHMLLVRAGAADDPYGKTGLAHYLEHLMFTGSQNYPEGVYDHTIARLGGTHNAYTTKDFTLYFATVAREHLGSVMAMEADRFSHPTFSPEKVARELRVITEERNSRVENNAFAQMAEQLGALALLNHPYHHPTIGWAEDMATLSLEDARTFFRTYYRPSNMMLLVAGDVEPGDVLQAAQHYYGSLTSGEAAPRIWPDEPPLRLERRATMRDAKVHEPRLLRQYVASSALYGKPAQALPLALLSHYLGGNDSSLLYRKLVQEQKLASSVDAEYDPFSIGPALFTIVATPAPGVTLEQLEQGLDAVLEAMQTQPLDAAAFASAKIRLKAEVIFAQDGLSALANAMASLYAIGLDEQYFYSWQKTVGAVPLAAMQDAARATLVPAHRVTGYLLPPKEAAHAP